ncbi:hypothetical protein BaRGS_00027647 [Batillaria attramentaria]|uniref:Uncharacterized protein n=1 Tax=Batillaria attramentaria TaxID=370345 RepID=A0ABD0K215_9CAEN
MKLDDPLGLKNSQSLTGHQNWSEQQKAKPSFCCLTPSKSLFSELIPTLAIDGCQDSGVTHEPESSLCPLREFVSDNLPRPAPLHCSRYAFVVTSQTILSDGVFHLPMALFLTMRC